MNKTRYSFNTLRKIKTGFGEAQYYSLNKLYEETGKNGSRLPNSVKILLENILRNIDGSIITKDHVNELVAWTPSMLHKVELPFKPARVLLQDFTGVPAIVDLAALRSAVKRMGGNPDWIDPLIPVDLVIDHSIQVDVFNSSSALKKNTELEFKRNQERYEFLHWGQNAFHNIRVIPPASGICHQVNLEYLAKVVQSTSQNGGTVVFPDTLVGTDSHTPMVNGLGVVGWGVGGIEAEAGMLGQPLYILTPEVIGVKLFGELPLGTSATDLVLTVTEILRRKGVVGKLIEFFGEGLSGISAPDRATIANMAPEYGATIGYFPVDAKTLDYLTYTGRSPDHVELVECYCKEQGLFRTDDTPNPLFMDVVELDLSTIKSSISGPKRPQDRVNLHDIKKNWQMNLQAPLEKHGYNLLKDQLKKSVEVKFPDGRQIKLQHGDIAIAAITSCTNTSNPKVMLAAGLLAKKAIEAGLTVKSHIKTSLAPGSKVVTDYLQDAGLLPYLERLGFHVVGYGCTTCIGNSGQLPEPIAKAVVEHNLILASVLSGNRNFPGRINPHTKASYLTSPSMVVAFAIAGTVEIDLENEPLGRNSEGLEIFLREILPTETEIEALMLHARNPEIFQTEYENIEISNDEWNHIKGGKDEVYMWKETSDYIQEPPFLKEMKLKTEPIRSIKDARALVMAGDSTTTDHISPAGSIAIDSPAGKYLIERGVKPTDFNSYGSRRGNDRIMTRGTFANVAFRNLLAPDKLGGWTVHFPSGEVMRIFDASKRYLKDNIPTIVIGGKDYGMGS
ncbi:aconitate hydratase AcnA, partial [bacterium]|nr:aconitate hydratase AcnA [bacterium]